VSEADWRPTVWFNPWMYQSGEQIWAGLAHEVISQITKRMYATEREHFWLALNLRRVDADAIRRRVYRALFERLVPLAGLLLVVGLVAAGTLLARAIAPSIASDLDRAARGLLAAGTTGTVLAGIWRTASFFREQVAGSLSSLVRQPNYIEGWKRLLSEQTKGTFPELVGDPGYESRLGFLYLVQTDMQRVLDLVATAQRPVVVFVDDLDRCSPGTVAQVIEAINLFLAGQFPNCIFIIAMEPEMVAAHIEVAYKPLIDLLADDDYWGESSTLGWRFLDKIVQLPLSLPVLSPEKANRFLADVLASSRVTGADDDGIDAERVRRLEEAIQRERPSIQEIPQAAARAGELIAGTHAETREAMRQTLKRRLRSDDPEVQSIVAAVSGRVARNPREIKRFVNVFRFYAVIRQERETSGLPAPETLMQVAKLAVLAVRWPHLRAALGRHVGPTEHDTILGLLETPIPDIGEDVDWRTRRKALETVLADRQVPETLRASLLGSEDLCLLLTTPPAIGAAAAGYL
jgi:hypothetical protein